MKLKPIKWKRILDKPNNHSYNKFLTFEWKMVQKKQKQPHNNKMFWIMGEFEGLFEGEVEAFYITNEVLYNNGPSKKGTVYLGRSIPYRYGRRNHILTFKTIKEAKDKAQEICLKLLIDKFFIKEKKISRKVLIEKQTTKLK